MINRLHLEMIRLYAGDPKRIQHFCKVHSYSKLIAELEQVDEATRFILEAAALTHDIGIHFCEKNTAIAAASCRKRKARPLPRRCWNGWASTGRFPPESSI